ncbi:MAG: hypothetical protein V3V33_12130 [Candidatus Lokiarchaeia archaeon]
MKIISITLLDILSLGSILITMLVAISHLLLDILEIKRKKRFDEIKKIQDREKLIQEQQKIYLEQSKMNFQWFISAFPDFPKLIKEWLENPESLQKLYKKTKKFAKHMQEFHEQERSTKVIKNG